MNVVDIYIVYRIVRQLTTPFDETEAFKLGVIDANGKLLVPVYKQNDKQKATYTLFDRLIFNLKRLIEKLPGGKSKLGTYAAALFLLKEQMSEEGTIILESTFMSYLMDNDALEENFLAEQYLPESMLDKGSYKLKNTMLDTKGEHIQKNTIVVAKSSLKPVARILGVDVFQVQVAHSGKVVMVSHQDIEETTVKEDEGGGMSAGGAPANNMGGGNIASWDIPLSTRKVEIVGPEPFNVKTVQDKIFRRKPPVK